MNNIQKKLSASALAILVSALAWPVYASSYAQNKDNESSEAQNVIPDAAITTAINAKFLNDSKIKSLGIKVKTVNGKVKLTGAVPDEAMKDYAVQLARETNGVNEVISELEVKSDAVNKKTGGKVATIIHDSAITAAVKAKLLADPDIKGLDVHVVTNNNGVVTLTGVVPSSTLEGRAIDLAKSVEGTKEVKSQLRIAAAQ